MKNVRSAKRFANARGRRCERAGVRSQRAGVARGRAHRQEARRGARGPRAFQGNKKMIERDRRGSLFTITTTATATATANSTVTATGTGRGSRARRWRDSGAARVRRRRAARARVVCGAGTARVRLSCGAGAAWARRGRGAGAAWTPARRLIAPDADAGDTCQLARAHALAHCAGEGRKTKCALVQGTRATGTSRRAGVGEFAPPCRRRGRQWGRRRAIPRVRWRSPAAAQLHSE